jgi:hypothetical protein
MEVGYLLEIGQWAMGNLRRGKGERGKGKGKGKGEKIFPE